MGGTAVESWADERPKEASKRLTPVDGSRCSLVALVTMMQYTYVVLRRQRLRTCSRKRRAELRTEAQYVFPYQQLVIDDADKRGTRGEK